RASSPRRWSIGCTPGWSDTGLSSPARMSSAATTAERHWQQLGGEVLVRDGNEPAADGGGADRGVGGGGAGGPGPAVVLGLGDRDPRRSTVEDHPAHGPCEHVSRLPRQFHVGRGRL